MPEPDRDRRESSDVAPDAVESSADAAVEAEADVGAQSIPPSAPVAPGVFADPVVRALSWVGGIVLVLFLATVAGAMILGVINPPAPRTAVERDLNLAEMEVDAGSTDPAVWYAYISALVSTNQYAKAQRTIEEAQAANIDDPAKQYLLVAQVQLDLERGDYEKVLEDSSAAMKALEERLEYEKEQYEATKQPTTMVADGLGENYYVLLLHRAEAYEQLGESDEAISTLDEYLESNETAADIFIWRGDLKAEASDAKGAIADYEAASTYLPQDEALQEKLSGLGASDE